MTLDFVADHGNATILKFAQGGADDEQLAGIKAGMITAVTAAKRDYDDNGLATPEAGQFCLIHDVNGEPAIGARITEVSVMRFMDVPEDLAQAAGEENRNRWISSYRVKLGTHGGWSAFMDMVCIRFEVVEVLKG